MFSLARFRIYALRALLLAWTACAHAPAPVPIAPVVEPVVARATPGLFLYEVRGDQGSSHLLGTIHLGFGFDEVLTPDARRRFETATRVMTEADIGAADPERLLQAALLPPEHSLRRVLGEPTWQKLLVRIDTQIPPPLLDRLEPWLPTVMLGLEDLGQALDELKPGSEHRLMDVELVKEANQRGKQIAHFETVEEQIAVFDSISLDEQVRELARSLENAGSAQARALLSGFSAGDEDALSKALFDEAELASSPSFYDKVLFDRNARWLPVIEREIARGGAFIAVGAGHLLGERGLVAELKRRGYTVSRVGQ
jgi:uncharacterized protein YbaP (TraB family)